MSDPFRRDAPSATDDDLRALATSGPISRGMGMGAVFEEAQVTDRVLGFIQSDGRRAFDTQRARVFGEGYRNELSADEANARYGVDGFLKFDGPVNGHRAAEMNRQATERRFRQDLAARADLSGAETLGASLAGAATDPVMLPTWFIGGGGAALRAMRVAPAATRAGAAARGAAVGFIDGVAGGVAAEAINAGARISTGEDYRFDDGLRNVLFGGALGATVGGGVGAVTHRARPRGAIPDLIAQRAELGGVNPDHMIRIAELESSLNPGARNPRSSAGGLFQFIDSTARRMGLANRMDPAAATDAAVRLARENTAVLRPVLGRDPDGAELYLAHQQGAGGARELLRDPSRSAVDALRAAGVKNPGKAITLNGGRLDMTAGEFAGLWRRKFGSGASMADLTPPRPPRALERLTETERMGAFADAIEAVAEDAPADLGALLARNGLDALDEVSAVPAIHGRWLEADTAVTRRGGEVPVRFAVVELRDLKTSHTDDLTADAAYPAALQPRDRSRAGSQAANYELERDLNPALLMRDRAAAGGAPIVSPDGLVESGNGRTIALRRSAETGTEAWGRYQDELRRQGVDTAGFDRPVLVRMRTEPMTGQARAEMARAMNEATTEAFSPVEQARTDARRVDAALLDVLEGDDPFAAANRPFLRGFVSRVAPGEANALTDARGAISNAGRSRVQAALVQAAYGDDTLTAALFEAADPAVRAVGQALADAAPAWARMRASAPGEMDLTGALTSAVSIIREARAARIGVADLLETRLGQIELFGGEAISPETEAFVRLMFRDEALNKPRGSERIAEALQDYARGAAETPAGPDLFGNTPDGRAFLQTLIQRYGGAEGKGRTGLAYAGGSEPLWSTRELPGATAEPVGLDLRAVEPDGDGPGGARQQPEGGRGAGGAGDKDGTQPARLTPDQRVAAIIDADPELKALVNDTEALAVQADVDLPPFDPSTEPSTVAEAIRAAAFCLATEGVA